MKLLTGNKKNFGNCLIERLRSVSWEVALAQVRVCCDVFFLQLQNSTTFHIKNAFKTNAIYSNPVAHPKNLNQKMKVLLFLLSSMADGERARGKRGNANLEQDRYIWKSPRCIAVPNLCDPSCMATFTEDSGMGFSEF